MSDPSTVPAPGGALAGKAAPRGNYSHFRRAGPFIYTAGISSRRPDNTIAGAEIDAMGTMRLDIREQTRVVLSNIRDILASAGAGMSGPARARQRATTANRKYFFIGSSLGKEKGRPKAAP